MRDRDGNWVLDTWMVALIVVLILIVDVLMYMI